MTNVEMRWLYPNGANFAYDALNRITQVEQGNAWQIFTRHHYQYDNVGREVATWRDEESLLGTGRGERFEYTATNQLKNAWYQAQNVSTGAHQNAVKTQEYNYTPDMLNRSGVITNGIVEGYTANGLNQYTGVGGLSASYNDGNFNLTGFDGSTYVYGYTSQLISASKGGNSVQFTYDGLGRCVRRVVNGAARIFTYDGWKPILEWDGAGNWLALNIYGAGPDEILGRYDSIGRVLIYKRDRQGNVVALLGNDGNVIEKYSYDAFGKPTVTDNWGYVRAESIHENRFMFTGREWIKELGIYDYRNRFYHPGLGRFLQSDPSGFDAGDMNLFRYCGDDPVDRTDPMGLDAVSYDENYNYFRQSPYLNRTFLQGSYINVRSNHRLDQQCAKGGQFMAGTMFRNGIHGVPTTHNSVTDMPQWFQGPKIGANTNGLLVARGFINGVYPSLSPQQTKEHYGPKQAINHVGIQTAYDKKTGIATIFDQAKGKALGYTPINTKKEDWHVVLVPKSAGDYQITGRDLVPTAQRVDEMRANKDAGNAYAGEGEGVHPAGRP